MSLRHATTHDLLALAPQLNQYADWHAMHEFVRDVYGSNAVRAEVKSFAEYNDQYFEPKIEMIAVFDADGNELQPDLSRETAMVAEEKRADPEEFSYIYEDDEGYRIDELFYERVGALIHLPEAVSDEGMQETYSYDLTQPPPVPELYLEAE
jgi:hypothetical protein